MLCCCEIPPLHSCHWFTFFFSFKGMQSQIGFCIVVVSYASKLPLNISFLITWFGIIFEFLYSATYKCYTINLDPLWVHMNSWKTLSCAPVKCSSPPSLETGMWVKGHSKWKDPRLFSKVLKIINPSFHSSFLMFLLILLLFQINTNTGYE